VMQPLRPSRILYQLQFNVTVMSTVIPSAALTPKECASIPAFLN